MQYQGSYDDLKFESMTQQINLLQNNRSAFWMVVAFFVLKNWTHTPSASGSYVRLAVQQADESFVVLKNFKSYNLTSNAFFGYLNRFSDYFMLYQ